MPTTSCPRCGRQVQFPEHFCGNVIGCPAAGCGQSIQLPNADGTMPPVGGTPPTPPRKPDTYFLRHPDARKVVVGPLSRDRVRHMVAAGKVQLFDELSPDRQEWKAAMRCEPEWFQARRPGEGTCSRCGATLTGDGDLCPACAAKPVDADRPGGAYGVSKEAPSLRVKATTGVPERSLWSPVPLADFVSARAADAIVGVSAQGWLGLWSAQRGVGVKTWEFDPGPEIRVAVADRGGRAVLAVGDSKRTLLYLADFEYRKLRELTEIDAAVEALALSPDGDRVGLVDDGPDVRIYRIDPWKRLDRFPVEGQRFELCMAADRLAAADNEGRIEVWDLRRGKVEVELTSGRREPACPQLPLRMGFSPNGKRLFAAAGVTVKFASKHVNGLKPGTATVLGLLAGGIGGAIQANIINNNVPVIAERIANAQGNAALAKLDRQTALRVWDVERGAMTAEFGDVFQLHPTGLADAYYCPWGSAAVTLGETRAHAWDLSSGTPIGPVYELTEPNDVRRANEAFRRDLGLPTLFQRIDFTPDEEHALVLVRDDCQVRVVRWPGAGGADLARGADLR
jgi:hypothetical protein